MIADALPRPPSGAVLLWESNPVCVFAPGRPRRSVSSLANIDPKLSGPTVPGPAGTFPARLLFLESRSRAAYLPPTSFPDAVYVVPSKPPDLGTEGYTAGPLPCGFYCDALRA